MIKKLLAASPIAAALTFPVRALAQDFNPCTAGTNNILERLGGCTDGGVQAGDIIGGVVNFIFVIAVILALGFLIYGGVRWITSGGDKGGVENARNTIIAAIVGLVIVVLAYFILNSVILPFLGVQGFSELEVSPITQKAGDE